MNTASVRIVIAAFLYSPAIFVVEADVSNLPRAKVQCGPAISKAEMRTKQITSPGFPNPFPGNSSCAWAIYAENGQRIRMEFQVFKLLPAVLGKCPDHYVIVKSPFSSHSMGPFCGEIGLPTIVSTGNLIYIELHTVKPVDTDNYQGFKLAYKVTVESSSYELREDNSVEDVIVTVDPETMNILSPTVPPARRSRIPRPTTKSWRFRPSRRPPTQVRRTNYGTGRRQPVPTLRYPGNSHLDKRQFPESRVIMPTPEAATVQIEIIIAIAASAAVAIVIVITIAVLITMKRKGAPAPPVVEAPRNDNGGISETKKQIPEASVYPTIDPMFYAHEYPNYKLEYPNSYAMAQIAPEYHLDKKAVSPKRKYQNDGTKPKRKRRKRRTRRQCRSTL